MKQYEKLVGHNDIASARVLERSGQVILRALGFNKYRLWYQADLNWVNLYGYDLHWRFNRCTKIIGDA